MDKFGSLATPHSPATTGRVPPWFRYAMPTTFLIDPAGTIRYRFVGYLDESTLRSAIGDLLAKEAKP